MRAGCSRAIVFAVICAICLGACDRTSADFQAELEEAEAYLGMGEPDRALFAYRSMAGRYEDDPRWAGVMLKIAEIYSTVFDDGAAAMEALTDVIEKAPLTEAGRMARLARAGLREDGHDYQGAIEDYTALLKHFPEDEDAMLYRLMLAGVYLTARDFRQSRVEIKPLVDGKRVPDDIREKALFIAAEGFFLEGSVRRAASYYQWLIKDFPKSQLVPEAKLHLATCVEEMGYLGIARKITEDAAPDYPNDAVIEARLKSIDERGSKSASQMRQELGVAEPSKEDGGSKNVYKGDRLN